MEKYIINSAFVYSVFYIWIILLVFLIILENDYKIKRTVITSLLTKQILSYSLATNLKAAISYI